MSGSKTPLAMWNIRSETVLRGRKSVTGLYVEGVLFGIVERMC